MIKSGKFIIIILPYLSKDLFKQEYFLKLLRCKPKLLKFLPLMQLNDQLITLPNLQRIIEFDPITISSNSYVMEAIILMDQRKGNSLQQKHTPNNCILVVERKYLLGVFTTRDALRLVASRQNLDNIKLAEVIDYQPITLQKSNLQNTRKILSIFKNNQIDYLPVVDDRGKLVGTLSQNSFLQELVVAQKSERFGKFSSKEKHPRLYNQSIDNQTITKPENYQDLQTLLTAQFKQELKLREELDITSYPEQAENALHLTTEKLEQRVAERTKELLVTNQALQQEIKEHQATEAALQKSESIFRQFGENIQAHIWINNKDFSEVIYVSPAYEKIWGRSCQSLRDNPLSWIEAIYPEDQNYVLEELEKSTKNYQEHDIEYRIIHTDQSIRWLWVRYFPIKNEQGKIEYFGGIAEDITERKLAEQSVLENETRLKLALEIGKMGIWEKRIESLDTCIWSETVGPLYGLPKGSDCPPGGKFIDLIYPEDRHTCIQAITDALEKGKDFIIEYRVVWPDGSIHWLSSTGKVFYDYPEMESLKIVGTTTYISERKCREDQIREQAALLNVATDAIFVRDFRTEVLLWNKGAERMYGFKQNDVVGKKLHQIFDHKTTKAQEATALRNVLKFDSWQGELRKQTKSGQVIIVESRWTLMLDSHGQPKSILIVDTDITEQKQLEEQLLRSQRLESIGTLASGIAHNLNNTLTPISTAAQLLEGNYIKDENQYLSLLNIIENNAKRGSDLVKQVLSFARGLQGEQAIIQVRHLIKEIIEVGQQTICKSIGFKANIEEDLWTILGDSTQIYQVLMNLVVNATHAMPDGGLLTISAENIYIDEAYTRMHQDEQLGHYLEAKVGNHIVVTVSDTGTGISAEILERIFEPFFTTKEADIGTGVGLSTVKVIMNNHNGFLTVTSQLNQGTTFKLFFPSIENPQVSSFENLEIADGNEELILVVDDEPEIREVAKMILERHNYQFLNASNGLDAIAIYGEHQQQIACVIMDMMMPEMDGTTAIYSLRKINPEVKVITCSGMSNKSTLAKLSDIKVQAVLSKPYTAHELLINLHQVISNQV